MSAARLESRFAARLAVLECDALLGLLPSGEAPAPDQALSRVAKLCCEDADVRRAADALLAVHAPVPEWAVSAVLTSDDLVPGLIKPLALADGAAAAVCTAWRRGWEATEDERRGLRQAPLGDPLGSLNIESVFDSAVRVECSAV